LGDRDDVGDATQSVEVAQVERDGLLDEDESPWTRERFRLIDMTYRWTTDGGDAGIHIERLRERGARRTADDAGEELRTVAVRIENGRDAPSPRAQGECVQEPGYACSDDDGANHRKSIAGRPANTK
jgi:hypothetical protein